MVPTVRQRLTAAGLDPWLISDILDGLTEPVIVCDSAGVVCLVNAPATALLPEIRPGDRFEAGPVTPLAHAAAVAADAFEGDHHGRPLRGRRHTLDGGFSVWYIRDLAAERAYVDALLDDRSRVAFLAEAGGRLGLSLHRDQVVRATVALVVPFLADAAVVVCRAGTQRLRWTRFARGDLAPIDGTVDTEELTDVPGLMDALDGDGAEPDPWLTGDLANLGGVLPDGFGVAGALLVLPLLGAGESAGALIVARDAQRPGFDDREVALARQFALRAGTALATADLYAEQVHLGRVLQASLLPPGLPAVPGVALAGGYRPARETTLIGGDFYEVFPTSEGGFFTLGDVCGKGVEAAVLSGRVRQALNTLRLVENQPLRLIDLLNRALLAVPDAARRAQYTTILVGRFVTDGGDLRMTIAGGGHPPPLWVRADGEVVPVPVGGLPVGALPDARYREVSVRLGPGDLLLAYSDGMTEARGGPSRRELFGEARLSAAVRACAGLPAAAMVDHLLQTVDEWLAGNAHDDIALLAMQVHGGRR